MQQPRFCTGAEAGLSGEEQIRIALRAIDANGGVAQMSDLYKAVEQHMNGAKLSEQGKSSLRFFINTVAVKAGYVYPHDPNLPGWRITPEGREAIREQDSPIQEEALDVDTLQPVRLTSNSARGAAFEAYVLHLLKALYPHYTWYHQGQHKSNERGLDFIGSWIGQIESQPRSIGVQVKFHNPTTAPSLLEWYRFMAGCFIRRVDLQFSLLQDDLQVSNVVRQAKQKFWLLKGATKLVVLQSRTD
ncbi:hypothetical protein [Chloroflexus sp.]|uniref:hypothetical protein n=1 Tax=Chloroflexus sp. TaxID=1904827 RepID=UPI00404B5EAB